MDFETWAQQEIQRLRSEADALASALHKYRVATGTLNREGPGSLSVAPPGPVGPTGPLSSHFPGLNGPAPPSAPAKSKWGPVVDALRAAGPQGLTIEEMATALERAGVEMKRNSLRGLVWHKKQAGEVFPRENGRYSLSKPSDPGAGTPRSLV